MAGYQAYAFDAEDPILAGQHGRDRRRADHGAEGREGEAAGPEWQRG